jgi:hypothetical protein
MNLPTTTPDARLTFLQKAACCYRAIREARAGAVQLAAAPDMDMETLEHLATIDEACRRVEAVLAAHALAVLQEGESQKE